MPRYIIDFAPGDGPLESAEADLPDIEAARMYVLNHVSSFFEQCGDRGHPIEASSTIRGADGAMLETVHSVAEWVPE